MAPDDPVKLSVLTLTNTSRRAATTQRLRLRRMVPGATARRRPPVRRHGRRRGDRRDPRAQRLQHGVRRPRRRLAVERAARVRIPATAPSSSGAIARSRRPAALLRDQLAGRHGAGLDPCGALQVVDRDRAGRDAPRRVRARRRGPIAAHALELAARYRRLEEADATLDRVERMWDEMLGAIQVHTPDDSFDLIVNRWLLYQTLSCRIWARCGLYQPGGAFGFRDQLAGRAGAALSRSRTCAVRICFAPRRVSSSRATCSIGGIRRAAAARARAVRTTCSGCRTSSAAYVSGTGDESVLDEDVAFLEAPPLEPGEDEAYLLPTRVGRARVAVRARGARHQSLADIRRARAAAHRLRRLERRHEPRRPRRRGRERVAGMVPRDGAERVRTDLRAPADDSDLAASVSQRRRLAHRHARARLGRRLVSARVFRRWHAARDRRRTKSAGSIR